MMQNQLSPLLKTQPVWVWAGIGFVIVGACLFPLLDRWLAAVALIGLGAWISALTLRGRLLNGAVFAVGGALAIGVLFSPTSGANIEAIMWMIGLLVLAWGSPRMGATCPVPSQAQPLTRVRFNHTPAPQEEFFTHIQYSVDSLIKSAQAVNEATRQQSDGASEQLGLIQHTTDQVDHFIDLSKMAIDRIRELTRTAQDASSSSAEGQTALSQAMESMTLIRSQVAQIGETTLQLAQLTRRIDRIITSVSEIATQSNLLALNASIEAARAGIHGRGFAVVADEVRALAQQSTQAAQQVRAILGEIQNGVKETVLATETGIQQVDAGEQVTQAAHDIMTRLNQHVNDVNNAIRVIAHTLREQADGMEEIGIGMDRVNRITQQNQGTTRVVEQVSQTLLVLASELQQVMDQSALAVPEEVR